MIRTHELSAVKTAVHLLQSLQQRAPRKASWLRPAGKYLVTSWEGSGAVRRALARSAEWKD